MTVFYTSDTHFGHKNIIGFCDRPFDDIEEMNRALIERWNAKVSDADDVYVLGDFAYRCGDSVRGIAQKLKGRKHLVIGNHDFTWMKDEGAVAEFDEVAPLLEIVDGKRCVTLCHYPMMSWRNSRRSFSWHIHGHIHNSTGDMSWPLISNLDRMLNAGVDVNGFEPVSFEEMLENNIAWKAAHARS